MANFITRPSIEEVVEYYRAYDLVGRPGCGSWFPCDKDGNIKFADMTEAAKQNYQKALEAVKTGEMEDNGVEERRHTYRVPGLIACDRCGHQVDIDDSWLNCCEHCGADYDGSGNLLAPRSQWGEETGESLADILGPGDPDY